ncbi:MAG: hypothetical protein JWP96_2058 [Polaromonas sp.]|nr:hypothetical protein [Polaromonas sp.]
MCLIAFAIGASKHWPLVLASNRDEFLDRPTLPLATWQTDSGQAIISGRDLRAGGTWLGMTPDGRVAFLTNVRQANPQDASLSRGELVTRWLESSGDAQEFAATLKKNHHAYGGFNLIIGDIQREVWVWATNRSPATAVPGWHVQTLPAGIYGLSNAALDTPWPKTLLLKRALANSLAQQVDAHDLEALKKPIWTALFDRERADVSHLPSVGIPKNVEKALSSAFVEFPENGYGTRCSTVLVAARKDVGANVKPWRIQMEEKSHLLLKTDVLCNTAVAAFAF